MAKTFYPLDEKSLDYANEIALKETSDLLKLRKSTDEQHEFHGMMTPPEQTQFLCFLLKMIQAKRVIEVGVFTGYTTLAMAQTLPVDGEVIACEAKADWVSIGQPIWREAGVEHKIHLCIDDAKITLQNLLDEGQAASFDFIYVDADKINYQNYLELVAQLIQPNGVIVFDNVLRLGEKQVVEGEVPATRALQAFNRRISKDPRFDLSLLPMCYGVLLLRLKGA